MRGRALFGGVALAALLLVACGDDDDAPQAIDDSTEDVADDTTTTTETPDTTSAPEPEPELEAEPIVDQTCIERADEFTGRFGYVGLSPNSLPPMNGVDLQCEFITDGWSLRLEVGTVTDAWEERSRQYAGCQAQPCEFRDLQDDYLVGSMTFDETPNTQTLIGDNLVSGDTDIKAAFRVDGTSCVVSIFGTSDSPTTDKDHALTLTRELCGAEPIAA
jgi:hypothetical protein